MHSLYINFDEDFKQISATISTATIIYIDLSWVCRSLDLHTFQLSYFSNYFTAFCLFFCLLIFPISTQLTDFLSFAAVDLPRRVEKSVYFATQYIYNILIPNNIRWIENLYALPGHWKSSFFLKICQILLFFFLAQWANYTNSGQWDKKLTNFCTNLFTQYPKLLILESPNTRYHICQIQNTHSSKRIADKTRCIPINIYIYISIYEYIFVFLLVYATNYIN